MTQPGYDPRTQVLNVGTFGDVGPPPAPSPVEVTPDAAPVAPMVPEGALDYGPPTDVTRPVTGGAVPVNYGPAPPVGTPGLSPGQANVATLRNSEEKKDINAREGGEGNRSEQEAAKIEAQHEAEQAQRATDYEKFLKDEADKQAQRHAQVQKSYLDVQKATGNKKNAADDFWKDKSTGYRVLSGLAAFASGFGSSLLHETGNPYLEHLDKLVDQNWQAHRENVDDLFKQQVQQGKIGDDDESYRNFMAQAKLHAADLGEQHIKSQLERVKHTALGQNYVTLADKTINDIDQREVERRAAFAQAQAQAAAAQAAAYRAKQDAATKAYNEAYKLHVTDWGPDKARQFAAQQLQASGLDRSILAPIMEANGGQYNQKSGQFEFAEPEQKPEEGVVPSLDPNTGKRLKPEDQEKYRERVVVDADTGKERLASNKEAVRAYNEHSQGYKEANRLTSQLEKAFNEGDEGAYHQARQALIELAPKLYGYTRGPSGAQAGEGEDASYKATVAGQLPESISFFRKLSSTKGAAETISGLNKNSPYNVDKKLISSWKDHLEGIHASMNQATFGGQAAAPEQEAYKPKSFQPSK